jgi:hypothetical protein
MQNAQPVGHPVPLKLTCVRLSIELDSETLPTYVCEYSFGSVEVRRRLDREEDGRNEEEYSTRGRSPDVEP